jgi:hypothetical protein
MTGNPNVLREYKTPDGFKLGRWQSSMRYAYQKGRLSKKHVRRLTKIGFVWHLIKDTSAGSRKPGSIEKSTERPIVR